MQLKPLADVLVMVQGDNATLAVACRVWFILAKIENFTPHYNAVTKRMKPYLQAFQYLAYMTHTV